MKKELMDILACPVCKSPLSLKVVQENSKNQEVVQGTLTCTKCREVYPIEDYIPNLLPPELKG